MGKSTPSVPGGDTERSQIIPCLQKVPSTSRGALASTEPTEMSQRDVTPLGLHLTQVPLMFPSLGVCSTINTPMIIPLCITIKPQGGWSLCQTEFCKLLLSSAVSSSLSPGVIPYIMTENIPNKNLIPQR